MKKITTEEFIKRANRKHNGKYRYSKAEYKGTNIPITITCLIHGDFLQRPNDHANKGQGCPECGRTSSARSRSSNTTHFINQAQRVHGDKYDYSEVCYKNQHTKVTILCPIHGKFQQKPNTHVSGRGGCFECGKAIRTGRYTLSFLQSQPNLRGLFYILNLSYHTEEFVKVGITTSTVQSRYRGKHYPYNLNILYEERMTMLQAFEMEQHLLQMCEAYRYVPELLSEGRTECLTIESLPLLESCFTF